MRTLHRTLVLMFAVWWLGGCATEDAGELGSPSDNTSPTPPITIVGYVASIDDQTPVDGGVTIELRLAGGEQAILLFGSLFTSPPPTNDRIELYEVIRQLEREDLVEATGVETERGIEITDLKVLKE